MERGILQSFLLLHLETESSPQQVFMHLAAHLLTPVHHWRKQTVSHGVFTFWLRENKYEIVEWTPPRFMKENTWIKDLCAVVKPMTELRM